MKHLAVLLVAVLGLTCRLMAQYYDAGNDPASVKWHQIKTLHFYFIYPAEMDSNVQKLASYAENAFLYNTFSLKANPKRLPVILHNRTVVSNGFLAWAPSRSEYYTFPETNGYAQDWLQQLAIHEYRHALQLNRLNIGTTKVLTWFLGEQVTAAVSGLYLPFWYLEGDAVLAETALSPAGRGRFPSFDAELKAQLAQKGMYSYDKACFGSYLHHVPNRYIMGYHLVSHSRRLYGADFWDNVEQSVARNPWMIVPFNYGIHRQTNLTKTALYRKCFAELDSIWKSENIQRNPVVPEHLTKRKARFYTSYQKPVLIQDSLLVAEKRGKAELSRIVLITLSGTEKSVYIPGAIAESSLTASDNTIVWTEIRRDPRWEQQSYSIIRKYDLNSRKTKTLTRKSRYSSPAISKTGNRLFVTELDLVNRCFLVELNPENGSLISRYQLPDTVFAAQLSWNNDAATLIGIAVSPSGKSIFEFNPQTKTLHYLLPWSFIEISFPMANGTNIWFTGAFDGTDQIYRYNRTTESVIKQTNTPFGATQAFADVKRGKLLFADYTADGYKLASTPFDSTINDTVDYQKKGIFPLADAMTLQEKGILPTRYAQDTNWTPTPYFRGLNLFRIHSWGPFRADADAGDAQPGFSIQSQNNLSTAITTFGYKYDRTEKAGDWFLDFTYKGWYPVLEVEASRGKRNGNILYSNGETEKFNWFENRVKTSVSLPLKYQFGKINTGITSKVTLDALNIQDGKNAPSAFNTGWLQSMDYQLSIYYLLKSAELDLLPRFGQTLSLYYSHTPFGNFTVGDLSAVETQLYLPGLFRLQRIRFYVGYQNRLDAKYYYSDQINYPRGYHSAYSDEMVSLSANYRFPLAYPDVALGGIAYIKRVKVNLFFDYAEQHNGSAQRLMKSCGAEFTSDMHLFRLIAPFNLGFRVTYLPDNASWNSDFILSVSFSAL
jgi:hypothetical protein